MRDTLNEYLHSAGDNFEENLGDHLADNAFLATAHYPLPSGSAWCVVLPAFLSPPECAGFIAQSEQRGFRGANTDYPPSYRNNDRQVLDSPALAQHLFTRLQGWLPATLAMSGRATESNDDGDESGYGESDWQLDSINERFRFCRYLPGQQFNIHQDGVYHPAPGVQSRLTFMIYLTDGDAFTGGDTVFYAHGPGESRNGQAQITARVRPRAGSLILFDHTLWHAGERVSAGVKHIMRSDVLYRQKQPTQGVKPSAKLAEPIGYRGHQGYVWAMARLACVNSGANAVLASGGRDTLIRLWSATGQALAPLAGHRQSVLGLAALPDGRLASVSRDRTLCVWNVQRGTCDSRVVAHTAAVLSVAVLPGLPALLGECQIVTGGADGLIHLWQVSQASPSIQGATLRPVATLSGHTGWVWALSAFPEKATHGATFASASEDGTVRLWRHEPTGANVCLHTLPGTTPLRALAISPDGLHLVTGDIDGNAVWWAWQLEGWVCQRRQSLHTAAVRRLRWLGGADTLQLASTGEDNAVKIWQWPAGECLTTFKHDNFVTDVVEHIDHSTSDLNGYLSCSYDGKIIRHNKI